MAERRPQFEERGRPRVQPGYEALPALAAVGAVVVTRLALDTGSAVAGGVAALLVVGAAATGLPALLGRTYTLVEAGTLTRGVAPEPLGPGDPTTVPVDRVARCEVVEEPRSRPPTDDDGEPLAGFGGPRGAGWPAGPGTLPDRPGVLVELDDGRRPRFPAVLPGPGIAGPVTVGEGPPGFLPTDRPRALVEAIETARAAAEDPGAADPVGSEAGAAGPGGSEAGPADPVGSEAGPAGPGGSGVTDPAAGTDGRADRDRDLETE